DTCIIAGTTLANQTIIEESDIDFNKGLILSHIPKNQFVCIMPTLSGAAAIDWVKKLLYPGQNYDEIEQIINQVPIGSRGVIYHPYLQGERAPFRNPFAAGSFFGLKSTHGKEELMRAAFEGIAMSLCDCFASLPKTNDSVYISGGASKNDSFCQMAADSLGKTIIRGQGKEAGIKGIVSVVKVALGHEKEFATKEQSIDKEFAANQERHEKYQGMFQLFQNLRYDYEEHWLQRNNLFKEK
ncbi:MAG: L-xylulokinase, partial [Bacillota bacterium]|nr:L-xylulokinase [Bacillota bacterium]